jgi:hypothetical protein
MRSCAAYTYTGEQCANGYIQTDLYLYQSEFDIAGEGTRYLTLSEIYVLSLIITHCSNPKKEECTSSIRGMGKTLGISAATVQRCISTLKRAELIFVKKRAVNGSGWTEYVVNEKLLRRREKSYRKTMKPQESPRVFVSPEVAAANARADRERYYSIARDHANAPVESTLRRLRTNQDYVAAENAVKKLDIEIARKDVYGTANEVATLQREQNRWKAAMAERMADMNISPDDLKPRYRCAKCSDTGFLPNGTACDCYPGNK